MAAGAGQRQLFGGELVSYVQTRSGELNLDPGAVLGVASGEGGFQGAVGDHGTSFGPWQLHEGGALPSGLHGTAARFWANTKAGIDYALGRIASVAKGLRGPSAVQAIVTDFEKPADGGTHDVAAAAAYLRTYRRSGGGRRIQWTGVSLQGVRPTLIASVESAALEVGAIGVDVTSAKRPPGPGNDVTHSNHISGDALDGFLVFTGGRRVPLGTGLKPVAGKYGLRSGDVAGFDPQKPGGYDPVHVDDGANVGGVNGDGSQPTVVRARPDAGGDGGGGGPLGWLGAAAGGAFTLAEKEYESLFGGGVGGLVDVFKGLIWLMNPRTWLRLVEFVSGALLMLFGLIGLAVMFAQRSETVGAAAGVAKNLPGPVGVAGKAVTVARRPKQAAYGYARRRQARERDEMDRHYRDRGDELDERRRTRKENREQREQERQERVAAVRARLGPARAGSDEVPF